jgi:hypothetical protein
MAKGVAIARGGFFCYSVVFLTIYLEIVFFPMLSRT